ncbi:MAG TPA: transporter [Candidatus Eisenbacteria bacterium]|nr:transporter [Candidatus Eisenbacteria bacterium]
MFRHDKCLLGAIVVLAAAAAEARGQEPGAADPAVAIRASKAGYHLFHPTPRALLREMSTDRPDLTESPYTVDAGHAQIEVEAVTLTHDEGLDKTGYAGFLVKLGLTPRSDLQIGFDAIHEERDSGALPPDPSTSDGETGPTNLTARLKWNLWGNDGGSTALAAMPYVEFPTAEGETQVGGGLIVPLAISGPWETGLATMAQMDVLPDADGDGHHVEWLFTGTIARDLVGSLAGFLEGTSGHRPRSEGEWTALLNAGLTFAATPDLQLDGGTRLGVSDEAEGVALFLGISYRR